MSLYWLCIINKVVFVVWRGTSHVNFPMSMSVMLCLTFPTLHKEQDTLEDTSVLYVVQTAGTTATNRPVSYRPHRSSRVRIIPHFSDFICTLNLELAVPSHEICIIVVTIEQLALMGQRSVRTAIQPEIELLLFLILTDPITQLQRRKRSVSLGLNHAPSPWFNCDWRGRGTTELLEAGSRDLTLRVMCRGALPLIK